MKFSELNLHPELLEGISSMNITTATPIQEQAIPHLLEGKDLIGIAQTGTGKTAAFLVPILNMIVEQPDMKFTQALIIVPTRELALQIDQAVEAFSYFTGISSISIYGGGDGADFSHEKQAIIKGVDIIIATPGRLISHMHGSYLDFSNLRFLVLDEADRMLDMGFLPDLSRIVRGINPKRQTLMFSATMPPAIANLASSFMIDPIKVSIAISKPASGVKQGAYVVFEEQKLNLILHILHEEERKDQSIIVFCSRKHSVSELYKKLKNTHLSVGHISSDLEQDAREEVMQKFRNRQTLVIIATDVISRGIDIDGIDLVVNYDVPRDAEDYVHRIGRTARAQRKGEAITLISPTDQSSFARIEKLIEKVVDKYSVPETLGATPPYEPTSKGKNHKRKSGSGKKPFLKKKRPPQKKD